MEIAIAGIAHETNTYCRELTQAKDFHQLRGERVFLARGTETGIGGAHMLVLDGVYANEKDKLHFQPLLAPAPAMMTQLLDTIVLCVLRRLERDGLLIRDPDNPGSIWKCVMRSMHWVPRQSNTALRSGRRPAVRPSRSSSPQRQPRRVCPNHSRWRETGSR